VGSLSRPEAIWRYGEAHTDFSAKVTASGDNTGWQTANSSASSSSLGSRSKWPSFAVWRGSERHQLVG
jgi:hypothetical protein